MVGWRELLILLVIVLLIFGAKRLRNIGEDLGGAVKGGRVVADWPGLAQAKLYEGRDLKPTTNLDAFIGGAVAGHFGLEPARAMSALFPTGAKTAAVEGLVRV